MKALHILKKISDRMFYRVFFTYSTIIFLTMSILFLFLSDYYSDFIIQKEIDKHEAVIRQIHSEIQAKHTFVKQGVLQLYLDQRLIEDLAFALQHDYQEYISYRLDKFSNSQSFVPYHFDLFVKNYFSRDSEVVALRIRNETFSTEYMYLYNRSRWQSSKPFEQGADRLVEVDEYGQKEVYKVEEQINDPISLERLGNVTAYFTYDHIKRLLSLREDTIKGTFLITDSEMNLRFSYGDLPSDLLQEIQYSAFQKKIKVKEDYYVQAMIEPTSKLMVTAIIPKSELAQLFTYKITILSFIFFLTCLAIALPYYSLRGYSKRVDHIVQKMREVKEGDLTVRIPTSKMDDDLTIISNTFNETLEELNEHIQTVYASKLKQKEAELANLQAQINPHFLYNTLEAIRMKSLAEGGRTSAKMIVQLAQLFRYSIKTGELVTVENEQDHAHQYIELFKIRFQNQLRSQFQVEEKLKNYYLPPFILQPLIENFLLHGFRREALDNELSVAIFEREDKLWIEIKDNGKGIPPSRLEEIRKRLENGEGSSDSIGLGNVNQRIRMKYGDSYGVSIESIPDVQTIVTVQLPLISEVS